MLNVVGQRYAVHFILVDDGSTDETWKLMSTFFQDQPNCTLLRHPVNLGLSAAILSGIRSAKTEIVCSIDSDCSYDPRQLANMIPMLAPNVDLVTASPYHPLGEVLNVPRWRLFLSKTASRLYRRVLKQKLYTYTSCFRVYRRSAVLTVDPKRLGFLGVAELIGKLDLRGSVVLEFPAILTTRIHGISKMRTAQVLFGHVQLLCELTVARVCQAIRARLPLANLIGSQG